MPVSLDDMLKDVPADRRAAIERHAEKIVLDNRRRLDPHGADPTSHPKARPAAMGRPTGETPAADRDDR